MLFASDLIAFCFNIPAQRLEVVKFNLCKKPSKLIGYHSNVP